MKIKIIDLLNKMANGEEVPEKIKYDVLEETQGNIYTYSKKDKDYIYIDTFDDKEYFFGTIFNSMLTDLNDEVEIIEEDKKIEKIELCMNYEYKKNIDNAEKDMKTLVLKINELIDVINNLKGSDD